VQGCVLSRDLSVSRRSRDVLTCRFGFGPMRLGSRLLLGAICLGLSAVGLVSGLGPLRFVEMFCVGARRAFCSVAAVRAILTSVTFVA